ncbi:hypothetical protein COW36_16820 [bacterium (Candidatus Blackallbacteria) CG17_big_fil_post_rev_8_21_14_2_50_48_46]|uniref:Ankyrin repeat domain-containing protein n=1 Tax=bacterium (Candidatus Blackallbacteria) CG17_big_fil_post_rev_8_21_14_2_50_48_46 TaxID=2014261 RepID=A0A2M7G1F8_9BACT|nr:MAG: hypothetical protein COW64_22320 [bacterium (Candidatus Blackallbacteria) CG18_big_fil_WC_8_21_14_2_50_49_26]PIW15540.1 MAG: hypothetical protein COW36_16820 [bacterium (Candidatus Blackallbacteria) CG17_big_fil_post_rev_8_21_14_2_50_48_46]PIW50282.1 MAG: hypothetical protein COW20_03085 [bacterium (Candidatus Blackallbacteria) CG13_big_fil_rev_8_21_14_2_50_49_14]
MAGALCDGLVDSEKQTALLHAATLLNLSGDPELIILLLDHGMSPNIQDEAGETPKPKIKKAILHWI